MSPKPSSSSTSPLLPSSSTFSVDTAIDGLGTGRFQYLLLFLAGLCWTAESMEMLILSFIKQPLQCEWSITDPQAALITTSVALGMTIGATCWGLFADQYGRRAGFIVSTLFTFVFGILSAFSLSYEMLVVARGLVGIGIGGVPVSFSLLMEFLPADIRGKWGLLLAAFWALGAIFESIVALFVVPTLGWRWLIIISSMPLGLMLGLSFLLVESPRWLIVNGREQEALESLEYVAHVNGKNIPEGRLIDRREVGDGNGGSEGLWMKGARSLAVKIWILWFVVAFVYYGLVMVQPEVIINENAGRRCSYMANECYGLGLSGCESNGQCVLKGDVCEVKYRLIERAIIRGEIVEAEDYCAKELTRADYMSTLWASVGELPGLIVAFLLVDLIGRRPMCGYMFGGCTLCFIMLLGCIGRDLETLTFFIARGASSGTFQLVYLYTNELYPSVIRATAMGISSSIARIGLMFTPFVAQYVENFNHDLAMIIYAGCNIFAYFVTWLIPIETTGRGLTNSMDELVELLRNGERKEGLEEYTFANDPNVSRLVRFFRWSAKVDGKASGIYHSA